MKKRWLLTSLLVLILCAGAVSAQAAVTSGGVEYLWYTQYGQQTWEDGQVADFSGGELCLPCSSLEKNCYQNLRSSRPGRTPGAKNRLDRIPSDRV